MRKPKNNTATPKAMPMASVTSDLAVATSVLIDSGKAAWADMAKLKNPAPNAILAVLKRTFISFNIDNKFKPDEKDKIFFSIPTDNTDFYKSFYLNKDYIEGIYPN